MSLSISSSGRQIKTETTDQRLAPFLFIKRAKALHKDPRREPRNRFMSRRGSLVEVDANPLTMLFVPPNGYGDR